MVECEECGSGDVAPVELEGVSVYECGLCGALSGDDVQVAHVLEVREARELGIDPEIFPLVRQLNEIPGLTVMRSEAGAPDLLIWPYVQMSLKPGADRSLESLTKSLALGNAGSEVHWVLELEYQQQLVLVLKPRFHKSLQHIGAAEIGKARSDLARVSRNLRRDMFLSWWRA